MDVKLYFKWKKKDFNDVWSISARLLDFFVYYGFLMFYITLPPMLSCLSRRFFLHGLLKFAQLLLSSLEVQVFTFFP